jgi:uncharacterized protein (TIGR02266 family)
MWVEQSHGNELYFQRSGNLSEGGMYLEHTLPHPIGTVVTLQFTLPGEHVPVRLRGEIVGIATEKDPGMSVRFLEMDADTRVRIGAFLAGRG